MISRATPLRVKWMLVDSSGSMKPLDSPMAMTFLFQALRRRPVRNGMIQGSRSGLAGFSFSNLAVASSSDMCALENTIPQPMRCCRAIFQCQPASCAIARVYGTAGPSASVCRATARLLGSQLSQSS